nr:transposase family protein [Streptomyces sp. SID8350]
MRIERFAKLVKVVKERGGNGPGGGRPWCLPLADRVLLVAVYYRTNLTMRQLAPLFGISAATVCRVIHRLRPLLALEPTPRPVAEVDRLWIVDGTLIPVRDRKVGASSRNYRSGGLAGVHRFAFTCHRALVRTQGGLLVAAPDDLLAGSHRRPTLEDPWPGKSSAQVAESVWTDELSTPAIPPEVWWPLLRAAWAYIDRFAPGILAERDRRQAEPVSGPPPQMDSDRELEVWLADPGTSIPLNARNRGRARRGEVNWRRASQLATSGRTIVLFAAERPHGLKRRQRVLEWLAETGRSHTGLVREPSFTPPTEKRLTHRDRVLLERLDNPDNLIPVHRVDDQVAWAGEPNGTELARLVYGQRSSAFGLGSKGKAKLRRQWVCEVACDPNRTIATDHGLNPRMLRAACFVFVAALTAMRDSEIHEIERGALSQYYGAPALASRKVKGDDSRPRGYVVSAGLQVEHLLIGI